MGPASSKKDALVIQTPKGTRHVMLADRACWIIGRGNENDIVIADHLVSRRHAMLQQMADGSYMLVDLGSRNGTFLNTRRVAIPTAVSHGDRITIGPVHALVELPSASTVKIAGPTSGSRTEAMTDRKLLTVLVVDIRQYTRLSAEMEPAELSRLIGTWFSRVGDILAHYGSSIDKYIGDALMAIWCHEKSDVTADETVNLFRSLHAIDRVVEGLNREFVLPFPLRVSAGLNTGYAMVGNTGDGTRPDYTALGDTVNAAFRLETVTREHDCHIAMGGRTADALQRLVGESPIQFRRQMVTLKGFPTPVEAYLGGFENLADAITPFATRA